MQQPVSKAKNVTGWVITIIIGLFMLFMACMQLAHPPSIVASSAPMGYDASSITVVGALLFLSALLYLIPQTSVLGALLFTAYFGGAVETHIRMHKGAMALSPVIACCIMWLGIYLREPRLSALLPVRK